MLISKHLYKEENPSIMIIGKNGYIFARYQIFTTYDIFSMSGKRDTSIGVWICMASRICTAWQNEWQM